MKNKTKVSRRFLHYLLAGILLLTLFHLVFQYINIRYFNETAGNFFEVTNRLDFDDEASIPTWFSQLLFLVIALVGAALAFIEKGKKSSYWVWLTISLAGIIGSVDEVSTIHETGLQGLHLLFFDENTPTVLANAWIIVVPVILSIGLLFLYKAKKVLPAKTIKQFIVAATIYIVGAVGIDVITSSAGDIDVFITQGLLVAVEEGMELLGLSYAIYALMSYAEENYRARFSKSLKILRK